MVVVVGGLWLLYVELTSVMMAHSAVSCIVEGGGVWQSVVREKEEERGRERGGESGRRERKREGRREGRRERRKEKKK